MPPVSYRCPFDRSRCSLRRRSTPADQHQRQHLHGLAQTHVVGQARAEAKAGEQMEPPHAHLLVGSQCRLEIVVGVDPGECVWMAKSVERVCQPRTDHHARPVRRGVNWPVARDACAGEQAHRVGETEPAVRRRPLNRSKLAEHGGELVLTQLYPPAADEVQTIGPCEQRLGLGGRQTLAVERDLHLETHERASADAGGCLSTNRRAHLRTRRTIRSPRARQRSADQTPWASSLPFRLECSLVLYGNCAAWVEPP